MKYAKLKPANRDLETSLNLILKVFLLLCISITLFEINGMDFNKDKFIRFNIVEIKMENGMKIKFSFLLEIWRIMSCVCTDGTEACS